MKLTRTFIGLAITSVLIYSPAYGVTLTLESGINGNIYMVEGAPGTAGTLGVNYTLGTYLAGGNGGLGHGFNNQYNWHGGHFCGVAETDCYVSTPVGAGATGALEATDHNWAQGTTNAIVVDLGAASVDDRAIVFNSLDHLGVATTYNDAEKDLWNAVIEGLEFTVYGSNNLADALAAAGTPGVFGNTEAGSVPLVGAGSSFEQGVLDYVFLDGWADFGNTNEGDDFASVWKFSQNYQYIAVYSNNTDPFIGDGFRSEDNELDAIGRFIGNPSQVPEPSSLFLLGLGFGGLIAVRKKMKA